MKKKSKKGKISSERKDRGNLDGKIKNKRIMGVLSVGILVILRLSVPNVRITPRIKRRLF